MAHYLPPSFEGAQDASFLSMLPIPDATDALLGNNEDDLYNLDNLFDLFCEESHLSVNPHLAYHSAPSPQAIMDMFNKPKHFVDESVQQGFAMSPAFTGTISPLDVLMHPIPSIPNYQLQIENYGGYPDLNEFLKFSEFLDEGIPSSSTTSSTPYSSRRGSVSTDTSEESFPHTSFAPPTAFDGQLFNEDMASMLSQITSEASAHHTFRTQSTSATNPNVLSIASGVGKTLSSSGRRARAASAFPYPSSSSKVSTRPTEASATALIVCLDGKVECSHCSKRVMQKNLARHCRQQHPTCGCSLCVNFAKANDDGCCPICTIKLSSKWNLQTHLIGHYQGSADSKPASAKDVRQRVFDANNKIFSLEQLKAHYFY